MTIFTQEIKDKWIKALRSGEYEQGRGHLRSYDNKFCCLGVLADVIDSAQWVKYSDFNKYYWKGGGYYENISYDILPGYVQGTLAGFNDSKGWSFDQIADYIEEFVDVQ